MRRWIGPTVVCAALLTGTTGAQGPAPAGKRAITHEDVFLMKRIGQPVVSPDGRWAAFPVTEPAYETLLQSSDIWIVPTDGSAPPRKFTDTRAAESGLAWSPDGTRLAWAARVDDGLASTNAGADATQIFVADVAGGGAPQAVTSVSTGARLPRWRPDGKAILFNADVYTGAKTDEDNKRIADERRQRKWNARVYESFPVRDWDRWLPERKASLWVQELGATPPAPARHLLAGWDVAASPGFGGQMGSGSESISASWADGTTVIFAATSNRDQAAHADVVQSLWRIDMTTGEVVRSTKDKHSYADPAVDASAVYARVEPSTDKTYNAGRLMRISAADGTLKYLDGNLDRSVGPFVIAPGGQTVYFLAEDTGRQKLYAARTDANALAGAMPPAQVGTLDAGSYSAFHVAGAAAAPVAVAVWESAVNPPEVVRVDLETGARASLTSFNTARATEIDLPPLQEFWFTSARGRRIHNFVAVPPAFDPAKKYPLFVVIHGGPHGQWMDQWVVRWNYHLLGAPGYVVLLTNFTGSTGFGEVFAQNIQGDPLETPGQEILQAVDEALKKYPFIDGTRMAAGGASYGGHLTNWLAVTTTRFKALISHAGLFDQVAQWTTSDIMYSRELNMGGPVWEKLPLWQTQNPILRSASLKTPMLVTAGERDFRVPINNTLQLWGVLQRQQVPGRLVVFPDENHWILRGENSRFFYAEVHAWLKKWL